MRGATEDKGGPHWELECFVWNEILLVTLITISFTNFYPSKSNQIQCYTHDKLAHTQYSQISNEQEEIQLSVLSLQFPIMNNSGGVCALHGCLAVQKTEHLTAL